MKITRRALARLAAAAAAVSGSARAQAPSPAAASDAGVDSARADFRDAARTLAAVKLPRAVEPASRFEA